MATSSAPELDETPHSRAELRELLAALHALIRCRVKRDVEGRTDVDDDADRVLAEITTAVRVLFQERHREMTGPLAVAWRDRLARIYEDAPAKNVPDAKWREYRDRVRDALSDRNVSEAALDKCCLTRGEVIQGEGPREVAKSVVANLVKVGARTLDKWRKTVGSADLGDDDPHLPVSLTFYGSPVTIENGASIDELLEIVEHGIGDEGPEEDDRWNEMLDGDGIDVVLPIEAKPEKPKT